MIFTYVCSKCGQEDLHKICQDWSGRDDSIWREDIELSEKEAAKLPSWDDPRFHTKEVEYGKELPEKLKCSKCNKKTSLLTFSDASAPVGIVKGNCFTNRERERKFYENGMDKQQAERFYKESIEASKERVNKGGESHYKRVDPDLEFMRKNGLVKKNTDAEKALKKENLKKINARIQEIRDSKKK